MTARICALALVLFASGCAQSLEAARAHRVAVAAVDGASAPERDGEHCRELDRQRSRARRWALGLGAGSAAAGTAAGALSGFPPAALAVGVGAAALAAGAGIAEAVSQGAASEWAGSCGQ